MADDMLATTRTCSARHDGYGGNADGALVRR